MALEIRERQRGRQGSGKGPVHGHSSFVRSDSHAVVRIRVCVERHARGYGLVSRKRYLRVDRGTFVKRGEGGVGGGGGRTKTICLQWWKTAEEKGRRSGWVPQRGGRRIFTEGRNCLHTP